jgi:predicted metal-binding protein
MTLAEIMKHLGIENYRKFSVEMLVPEARIRDFCAQNKCGNYGNNYMCPPAVGSIEEITTKLKGFQRGILLQYGKHLDVRNNRKEAMQVQKDFHRKILQLEEFLGQKGIRPVWGMIGGNCKLCDECKAKTGETCANPDQARMSLEAIGIDVLGLLEKLGLDNRFHADKITWTGCVLVHGQSNIPLD